MGKDFFDSKMEPQKKSIVEQYEEILFKKPTEAPIGSLCALFLGEDSTCKSGTALSYLTEKDIKEGWKAVVVDLDSGNLPLILAYHLDEYMNGSIIHQDPLKWTQNDEGKSVPDYDGTLQEITNIGMTLAQTAKKHKVKVVIFDGMSELKKQAEMKMRIDNSLGSVTNTSFDFKYYKERRQTFTEALKLYKALPIDKIFIGLSEFVLPKMVDPEKPPSAIKVDLNSMAFQRVRFRQEEDTKGNSKWYAKIDKNKTAGLANISKEICFAENTTNKKGERNSRWQPEQVFDLMKPSRK